MSFVNDFFNKNIMMIVINNALIFNIFILKFAVETFKFRAIIIDDKL